MYYVKESTKRNNFLGGGMEHSMAILKSQNYKLLILKKYYKYSTLICARWLSPSEQLSILELVFSIRSVIYEYDQIFQI